MSKMEPASGCNAAVLRPATAEKKNEPVPFHKRQVNSVNSAVAENAECFPIKQSE